MFRQAEGKNAGYLQGNKTPPEALSMFGSLKKYSPLAIIAGYAMVYANKGWDRIVIDLQNISIEKLTAKWQNFLIAAVAIVAIQIVKKLRFDPTIKLVVETVLYGIAGYQIALAIDPPYGMSGMAATVTTPTRLNPYSYP